MRGCAFAIALCLLAVCGCSTITFERKVENSIFFSLADPKLQVHVNPQLTYIGETAIARHHQNVHGARNLMVNSSSYLFVRIDQDNFIRSGVIIRVDRVKKSSWQPDLFADIKNKLVTDYEQIGHERFEHFIAVRSDIFTVDEMAFILTESGKGSGPVTDGERLSSMGCKIPKCFLYESFGIRAGAGRDTKFSISYFEDLASIDEGLSCREWIKADVHDADQRAAVRRFIESRKKNVSIIMPDK
ncbi:MAG TPA: hypothetical protein P5146_01970 [Desulfomonilia bacterium]|nr:hypothetical protein [Desulfomonilia bacterium]